MTRKVNHLLGTYSRSPFPDIPLPMQSCLLQTASPSRPAEPPRLVAPRVLGARKLFKILIRKGLRYDVQKAGDLPIVADIGNVIAGSGYTGWFVRKGLRELPERSDPATHAKSTQLLR